MEICLHLIKHLIKNKTSAAAFCTVRRPGSLAGPEVWISTGIDPFSSNLWSIPIPFSLKVPPSLSLPSGPLPSTPTPYSVLHIDIPVDPMPSDSYLAWSTHQWLYVFCTFWFSKHKSDWFWVRIFFPSELTSTHAYLWLRPHRTARLWRCSRVLVCWCDPGI